MDMVLSTILMEEDMKVFGDKIKWMVKEEFMEHKDNYIMMEILKMTNSMELV